MNLLTMSLIYQYSQNYVKEESIDECHAFVLKFLEEGLSNPDLTNGELISKCI